MEDTTFELIEKFEYNNKTFCKFINNSGKIAYLNIDKEGKFYYPQMDDLVDLVNLKMINPDVLFALDDSKENKKYKFIPKVWFKGVLVALTTTLLLSACSNKNSNNSSRDYNKDYSNKYETSHEEKDNNYNYKESPIPSINYDNQKIFNDYDESQVNTTPSKSSETYDSIINRIKNLSKEQIKANKYIWDEEMITNSDNTAVYYCSEHNYYNLLLGYSMPSKSDLYNTIDNNNNIGDYYKSFLKDWVDEWLNNYPGSDLAILNENLKTLEIIEESQDKIVKETHSLSVLACYINTTNQILVNKDSNKNDIEFKSILKHEILHAARTKKYRGDTKKEYVNFMWNTVNNDFLYSDEAFATLFTSRTNEGGLYRLISNCYSIILDATGYTGTDYMNHAPYELGRKMDNTLSDITTGAYLLNGMEDLGKWIYDPIERAKLKLTDVHGVLKTVIKIYLKLYPTASFEEVESVIMKDVDPTLTKYQELFKDDALNKLYYNAIDEMGISKGR